jgi:hypothetical protein
MKRLLALLSCIPALALAAGPATEAPSAGWKEFRATLAPGKIHEECQRVEAGQSRRFSWKSDAPVDFNVHYHRGNDVTFPVKRDAMRGDGGTFTAKDGEDYCWMWTARDKPAKIEGRVETP